MVLGNTASCGYDLVFVPFGLEQYSRSHSWKLSHTTTRNVTHADVDTADAKPNIFYIPDVDTANAKPNIF